MIVAIITARGGSKRIPRKNVKLFLGSPIIKYSIKAALKSGCFDEVMVSTDDKEIADISKAFGAKVPFMRSTKTAGDHATTPDVIEEVISEYKKLSKNIDLFCVLYPTAPFITPETLRKTYKIFSKSKSDSLVPVTRFGYPIQRALKITDGKLKMIWPKNYNAMSQDLMPAFHDCGQFYWMKTKAFLKQKRFFAKDTIPFEILESEVQDIDNLEDWKLAEIKFRILKQQTKS
jgi:pseudaminic acid cytidylyltransferase